MADLDKLARAMPQTTKEVSEDGRPSYLVHGRMYCFHRGRRPDAIDPETGERMNDVLMFRVADQDVKELFLADERGLVRRVENAEDGRSYLVALTAAGKRAIKAADPALLRAYLAVERRLGRPLEDYQQALDEVIEALAGAVNRPARRARRATPSRRASARA